MSLNIHIVKNEMYVGCDVNDRYTYIKVFLENAFTNWVHNDVITFHDVKIII